MDNGHGIGKKKETAWIGKGTEKRSQKIERNEQKMDNEWHNGKRWDQTYETSEIQFPLRKEGRNTQLWVQLLCNIVTVIRQFFSLWVWRWSCLLNMGKGGEIKDLIIVESIYRVYPGQQGGIWPGKYKWFMPNNCGDKVAKKKKKKEKVILWDRDCFTSLAYNFY